MSRKPTNPETIKVHKRAQRLADNVRMLERAEKALAEVGYIGPCAFDLVISARLAIARTLGVADFATHQVMLDMLEAASQTPTETNPEPKP